MTKITTLLRRVLQHERRGLLHLLAVALLAGSVLALPSVSFAKDLAFTSFSSPPPGSPAVAILISAQALRLNPYQAATTVQIQCSPIVSNGYSTTTASVIIAQKSGSTTFYGRGTVTPSLVCDNSVHTYIASSTLPYSSPPFTAGPAFVGVAVKVCGDNSNWVWTCEQGTSDRIVALK